MKENAHSVTRTGTLLHRIDPVIAGRWSSRAIDPDREVPAETVDRLLEAARWAPSAFNNQPWKFLVLTSRDPESLQKGRDALLPGNAWALNAPVLIYTMAYKSYRGKDRENWRRGYETGMAAVSMAFQAVHEGLVFHQMAGFSADVLKESFGISDTYDVFTAIAAGYPGREDLLDEKALAGETAERIRLDPEKIICRGSWEN